MTTEEDYFKEHEQEIEENQKPKAMDYFARVPLKFWFLFLVVVGVMIVFWKSGDINIWFVIIVIVVLLIIMLSGSEVISTKKQHDQPTAMKIVRDVVIQQIKDPTLGFPQGQLIMPGMVKPEEYIVGSGTICRHILVPFVIVDDSTLEHHYVGRVHPYEPRLMGVEKVLTEFRGTEITAIKYIIPSDVRLQNKLNRGKFF